MADKKISALTALAQGDVAVSTDVLPIVDTSATETKKIAVNALVGAAAAAGLTNVDINSGTIDGATIATSDITVGAGKTLNVSAGTLTLADNQISGDKVEGGTINAITINTLTSTAVNATTVDATNVEVTNVKAKDGTAAATIADSTGVVTVSAAPVMSALTASQAVFTTSGKALVSNAITGSGNVVMSASPTLTGTIDAAAQTLSGNLTLNGGTANGVLYLNGSKVATSGSALVYDGNGLGVGVASPAVGASSTKSVDASGPLLAGGAINAHQTSKGVFQYSGNETTIRSYGATASSGQIVFNIGGGGGSADTEGMRLTASGNLGIGTSSPGAKLDVNGEVRIYPSSSPAQLRFGVSGAEKGKLAVDSSSNMLFETAGSERMRLDSSGNLGLGVSPSTSWFSSSKAIQIGSAGAPYMGLAQQTTTTCDGYMLWGARLSGDRAFQYTTTGDAVCAYRQNAGTHNWFTAPSGTAGNTISFTQAMTLDASSNLIVGGTAAVNTSSGRGNVTVNGSSAGILNFSVGGAARSYLFQTGTDFIITNLAAAGGALIFENNGSERARITSGGVVAVNTTGAVYSSEKLAVLAANNSVAAAFKTDAGATEYTIAVSNTATSGDNKFVVFATESTDTIRGSITYNRGAGQVAYNVTSDVRLKDNITNAADAGNKVDALQVRQFDWKETGNHVDYGFVAQELHEVVPHSVSKPEDDGQMWSVDYSKLVPMLVKEIQSLRARVAQLESK